ncbi:MAG: sulfatase-like hydrolase/transferase [Acidobacteria bacterium]|nr:sulfatase-like hydrolase/transferase [Acidobacteriota bacterium]
MSIRFVSGPTLAVALWGVLWVSAGCGGGDAPLGPVRLVDVIGPELVEGTPPGGGLPPLAAWTFGDGGDLHGWKAGQGVEGLTVRDGKLTGRTTTAEPVLFVQAPETLDPQDGLFAIEVIQRVDQGAQAHASAAGGEPKFKETIHPANWNIHADLQPGSTAQTLTFRDPRAVTMSGAKFLSFSPTDAAGATFEIESVRLISQREQRASTPSGVGWQGLGGVYHETVVSRAPETVRLDVEVPSGAILDFSVGTVEPRPVTFRVDAVRGGEERRLFRRTVTTPHQWESARVDLSDLGGATTLRFSLENAEDFATGFWGSPVVRVPATAARADKQPGGALGEAPAPLGVIVFLADTLRRDRLPFNGYERANAPTLSALAADGAIFSDNISQATWTKVSVPAIMTSLYPTSHRVRIIPDRISVQANTLAESYRQAGYSTASFPSNSFAGMMTNLHQGFEESYESDAFPHDGHRAKTARAVVDQALEWLDRKHDGPFFAYVHVVDPHSPFEPRDPYRYKWASREDRKQHDADWETLTPFVKSDFNKGQRVAMLADLEASGIDKDRWLQYEQDWYDGSILGMDDEIRRIQEKLEELGIADRVLFAFISDHGEEFLEHGYMFHGQSAYGELANVPLFLRYPGVIPAGLKIDTTVRSIDLMPTLLQLSGIEAPAEVQGQSLLPLIMAASKGTDPEAAGWRPSVAVTEKAREDDFDNPGSQTSGLESYAMVSESGEWKLIHNVAGREPLQRDEYELYRHKEDPLDRKNVAAEHPDVAQQLAAQLDAWKGMATQSQLPRAKDGAGENATPEQLNQLRNLGYIQ